MSPDLQRFLDAQEPVYDQACRELREGKKRSHWMWFIFPQLAGLGHSTMARRYAIADRAHAEVYLAHSVLGARLLECAALVTGHKGLTALQIFGSPDYLKLHSSLTLFHAVAPDEPIFNQALRLLYGGKPDDATMKLLRGEVP